MDLQIFYTLFVSGLNVQVSGKITPNEMDHFHKALPNVKPSLKFYPRPPKKLHRYICHICDISQLCQGNAGQRTSRCNNDTNKCHKSAQRTHDPHPFQKALASSQPAVNFQTHSKVIKAHATLTQSPFEPKPQLLSSNLLATNFYWQVIFEHLGAKGNLFGAETLLQIIIRPVHPRL